MSAAAVVELDVTPPAMTWGPVERVSGRALVPYGISADGVVAAASIDDQPATVSPASLLSTQAYPGGALLDVEALAVDDVGNEAVRSVVLWLAPPGDSTVFRILDASGVHFDAGFRVVT